jgi:nucleotide-binding universal stress UspA family protein
MAVRDILVHIKPYEDWSHHIEIAAGLAKTHHARLTGLCTLRDIAVLKQLLGADTVTVKDRTAKDAEILKRLEAKFRDLVQKHGIVGDWQTGEGNASELLTLAGRFHDLIVVEQTDPRGDEPGWDTAEQTVLGCGKPTLVVPYKYTGTTIGQRVCVAWNGSRESALAVQAALPVLTRAAHVAVFEGPPRDTFPSLTKYPPMDVIAYLARHNVTATRQALTAAEPNVGSGLLAQAADLKADLIVMGGYGRSRFHEWIMGSTTGYVLAHTTIPVVMAH